MELASITSYKAVVMTVLALVGVFCYIGGIIDQESNKKLSDIVLNLLTPVLLFTSFQKSFSIDLLSGLLISALLSVISFLIVWGISKSVIYKSEEDVAVVEHIALMYSNCGFIGIPMAQAILGSEGVFYMTAYVAVANFLLWSHGVIVMSGKREKSYLKKVFTSPTIMSIALGVACFFLQIHLPQVIREPMEMIANMNTPMAMIVAGINIAQTNIFKVFQNRRVYMLAFVKLVVMPMCMVFLLNFIPINEIIKTVIVLATACPSGVTGSLFAMKYGKNAIYASEIFAMSTVLSVITVPFMMLFCG